MAPCPKPSPHRSPPSFPPSFSTSQSNDVNGALQTVIEQLPLSRRPHFLAGKPVPREGATDRVVARALHDKDSTREKEPDADTLGREGGREGGRDGWGNGRVSL